MMNIRRSQASRPRMMALLAIGGIQCCAHAPYSVNPTPATGVGSILASPPAITMLNMAVTLDEVAPGQPGKVGDVDRLRIVYDANAVDPKTHRVKLLNLQHFTGGHYSPPAPDSATMPMDDSWLDMRFSPYRLHYRASVVHGRPIIIEFDENRHRLTIHPQSDPTATLESGLYAIDPNRITGPEAIAAGTPPRAPGAAPLR
jgi:hypothetical protein